MSERVGESGCSGFRAKEPELILQRERALVSCLVSAISHDLNNVLSTLQTHVFLLGDVNMTAQADIIEELNTSLEEGAALTSELSALINARATGSPACTAADLLGLVCSWCRRYLPEQMCDSVALAGADQLWLESFVNEQIVLACLTRLASMLPSASGSVSLNARHVANSDEEGGPGRLSLIVSSSPQLGAVMHETALTRPTSRVTEALLRRRGGDVQWLSESSGTVGFALTLQLMDAREARDAVARAEKRNGKANRGT